MSDTNITVAAARSLSLDSVAPFVDDSRPHPFRARANLHGGCSDSDAAMIAQWRANGLDSAYADITTFLVDAELAPAPMLRSLEPH